MSVITADSLDNCYVGHCPLSEVYFIYPTFRELVLLPFSGDWVQLYRCFMSALS